MIYFDNAATTHLDERVFNQMLPFLKDEFGNPESVHAAGRQPSEAVEFARMQIAKYLLHTDGKGKIIFTSGGTESNNMAFGLAGNVDPLCMNIITSATEHKSVLEPARACTRSKLRILKPKSKGYISLDDLNLNEIPAFTLVSFMQMNNETGAINDVYEIGLKLRQFKDLDVFYHVDCVQSAGSMGIYVNEMNADLVSVSSHKIHGPKGVGCLWVSDRVLERLGDRQCLSLIKGGGQQDGFRAGTLNVPGIAGFGKAAELAGEHVEATLADEDSSFLSEIFRAKLMEVCRKHEISCKLNFTKFLHHNGKILSITFPGADAETLVMIASQNGLCISNGAACNSVSSEPSYVLTSSGLSPDAARNTVRVSFSRENTADECEKGAEILAESVREVLSLTGNV